MPQVRVRVSHCARARNTQSLLHCNMCEQHRLLCQLAMQA